jgi:hypothetical protein
MADQLPRQPKIHYQIGAPALIYREKIGKQSAFLAIPGHEYPPNCYIDIAEHTQRKNRFATRWNYATEDVPPIDAKKKRYNRMRKDISKALQPSSGSDERLQEQRRRILLHHQGHPDVMHEHLLETYSSYDKPYEVLNYILRPVNFSRNNTDLPGDRAAKLGVDQKVFGRNSALQRHATEDPAYLAPFCLDALNEIKDETLPGEYLVDKSKRDCFGTRPWQGNCLLCVPCPCRNCHRGDPSWCLFHPKGLLMDTLCVSNVMLPNSKENVGHFFPVSTWQEMRYDIRQKSVSACKLNSPNEVCLHDTILEVKQCGKWTAEFPDGTFVVRTASYVSVIRVSLSNPSLLSFRNSNLKRTGLYSGEACWGNYVLREEKRFDLRSLIYGSPSYRPVSLACHPRYGNEFTDPKFAFLSYAEHSGDQNTIHHLNGYTATNDPTMHTISSLRHITAIDFSKTHPMCLWAAASSYVRPTLVSEIWFKKQYPLGFGTSLYSIDLRHNSSAFQWSPSAEEMKQEGTYSISGIRIDWDREHTLWVSSKSAGKTWELDSRMPCKSVHSWSLGGSCDLDSTSFPERGPYADPVLLTKVGDSSLAEGSSSPGTNILLTADTTPTAFGLHILQRPLYEPRFQTESLECIAVPHVNFANHETSLATTLVVALPERDDDLYMCGLASFRTPIHHFISDGMNMPAPFESTDQVVCTLSMNNQGDIYCHSLLETSRHVPECRSFSGLPAGTAAISVPNSLNGRTCNSEHKRWKPTGGMNLKTFWTNQYPIPRNARPYLHPTIAKGVPHPRQRANRHPSRKLGDECRRFEVPVSRSGTAANLQMAAAPTSRLLNSSGEPLFIPQTTVDKALEARLSFRRDHVGTVVGLKEETSDDMGGVKEETADDMECNKESVDTMPKSDLSRSTLQKVSNVWEMWNQLDAESSSDEEDVTFGHSI